MRTNNLATDMIHIVGTNHRLQHTAQLERETNPHVDPAREEEARNCLKSLLKELALTAQPKLSAEAHNLQSLKCLNAESIAKAVADELEIEHLFCEPNFEQSKWLGIRRDPFGDLGEDERRRNDAIREKFWLDQISARAIEGVIFICGSDHVMGFQQLLQMNGINSRIEIEYFGKDVYEA